MKPHVRKVPTHPVFPGEFICAELGSSIYGNGKTIGLAIDSRERRMKLLGVALGEVSPLPPPTTEPDRPRHRSWQTLWLALIGASVLAALGLWSQRAHAVELQQCEWLSDQAYSQTWQRDAGVTFPQMKVAIRHGGERPEVKQGLLALSRYVYSHREKSPDDLADDILADCRSYDE